MKVHRAALWILGEFATSVSDIEAVIKQIQQALGEGSILEAEQRLISGDAPEENPSAPAGPASNLVTPDGTYATQSAFNVAT